MFKRKYGRQSTRSRYKPPVNWGGKWLPCACFCLMLITLFDKTTALPILPTLQPPITSTGVSRVEANFDNRGVQAAETLHSLKARLTGQEHSSPHVDETQPVRSISILTSKSPPWISSPTQVVNIGRRAALAIRAEEEGTKSSKSKSKSTSSKSSPSTKSKKLKEEEKAGDLPLYQMFIAFVFVVIAGGGILWWLHKKKMIKIERERKAAARALRKQYEWEKEAREIPNPELEMEADKYVESLPYAPEGLFYETMDPLAEDDEEGDIADENWWEKSQHRPHHHRHDRKHDHHQQQDVSMTSLDGGGSFYDQQSLRIVPRR